MRVYFKACRSGSDSVCGSQEGAQTASTLQQRVSLFEFSHVVLPLIIILDLKAGWLRSTERRKQSMGTSFIGEPTVREHFPRGAAPLAHPRHHLTVLGHFVFTETLLPLLKAAVLSSSADSVRIITTASDAHADAPKGGVNLEDQSSGAGLAAYSVSKMGNIYISQYWAEKLKADGVIAVHVVSLLCFVVLSCLRC